MGFEHRLFVLISIQATNPKPQVTFLRRAHRRLRLVVKRFFDDFLFSRAHAASKKIHNTEVML